MTRIAAVGVVLAALAAARADEPKAATPSKPHEWLAQLAGEWATDSEAVMAPGQPPAKCQGTESVRLLGGFWAVSEIKADLMGTPVSGVMTVGYDDAKKKYVGTFVCSMEPTMWRYEGAVEGNKLTLNTEGPDPATGKTVKMRDVTVLKSKDHKVLTSQMLGEDGKWVTFMTMTARRKK